LLVVGKGYVAEKAKIKPENPIVDPRTGRGSCGKGGVMAEGYCVKCKSKREMKEPEEVEMKNKRKALKGTCEKCGTKMFKILGKS